MKNFGLLQNTVQEYTWGSHTAIPDLLGWPGASDTPQAELWMGAHPKAPSLVNINGKWISLIELIERDPVDVLGQSVVDKFGRSLPFLFKVLAAEQPLSIQAHPNRIQAQEGYERENKLGIPLDAPNRNYRDAHHKPECLCALTPFWALNGFRNVSDMVSQIHRICPRGLGKELDRLATEESTGKLERFFEILMTLEGPRKIRIIEETIQQASRHDDPICRWITRLHQFFPEDIGILSPAVLNLVRLDPGEAIFIPAGELHAYLKGTGIEVMANSDNVLRGGLTAKHVDVPALLDTLNFEGRSSTVYLPERISDTEHVYPGSDEFILSVIELIPGETHKGFGRRSVEILLCTDGDATLTNAVTKAWMDFHRGTSVIVPAALDRYILQGNAVIYKVSLPAGTMKG